MLVCVTKCENIKLREANPLAKDLRKTLSPKSERKAKELNLEYANKEGSGEKATDILTDLDSGRWSSWTSSQASCLTDSGECDDFNVDSLAPIKEGNNKAGKKKVFAKLRRLLKGKNSSPSPSPRSRTLERQVSGDNFMTTGYSSDYAGMSEDVMKNLKDSSRNSSRSSFDLRGSYSQKSGAGGTISSSCSTRTSHDDSLSAFKRIESLTEDDNDWSPGVDRSRDRDGRDAVKYELMKFAEVLKNSHVKSL